MPKVKQPQATYTSEELVALAERGRQKFRWCDEVYDFLVDNGYAEYDEGEFGVKAWTHPTAFPREDILSNLESMDSIDGDQRVWVYAKLGVEPMVSRFKMTQTVEFSVTHVGDINPADIVAAMPTYSPMGDEINAVLEEGPRTFVDWNTDLSGPKYEVFPLSSLVRCPQCRQNVNPLGDPRAGHKMDCSEPYRT